MFSQKVNHASIVSLYFMYCNFGLVHQTLRVTAAMEAGVVDHIWTSYEIVAVWTDLNGTARETMGVAEPTVDLNPEHVRRACLDAAAMISGMGYHGPHGSFHLLDLNLQANTVTAILHNLIAWQLARLDPRWTFRPKGGSTPDLTGAGGLGIQVKVTSDKTIKGNYVSSGSGYYVAVKYLRKVGSTVVEIAEIRVGWLTSDDWDRRAGTQWAMLTRAAEQRMVRIYPT